MENYLNTAIKAVTAASMACREIQNKLVDEDSIVKKDKSPVTIADYASQAIVCSILNQTFPNIPIVGEEDTSDLSSNKAVLNKINIFLPEWSSEELLAAIELGNGSANDLFWTLDPIDGTKGFLRGEQYAVALALIKEGEIVLGVLGCPNLAYDADNMGTILYATEGEGSVALNFSMDQSRDITVSNRSSEESVRFLESVEKGHANHDDQAKIIEAFGERKDSVRVDSQVKYAMLAQGAAEVYLRLPKPEMPDYREKIWDHAAGVIIVEEAGGIVSDSNGKPLDFSQGKKLKNNLGVIGTNGQFHDFVLKNR